MAFRIPRRPIAMGCDPLAGEFDKYDENSRSTMRSKPSSELFLQQRGFATHALHSKESHATPWTVPKSPVSRQLLLRFMGWNLYKQPFLFNPFGYAQQVQPPWLEPYSTGFLLLERTAAWSQLAQVYQILNQLNLPEKQPDQTPLPQWLKAPPRASTDQGLRSLVFDLHSVERKTEWKDPMSTSWSSLWGGSEPPPEDSTMPTGFQTRDFHNLGNVLYKDMKKLTQERKQCHVGNDVDANVFSQAGTELLNDLNYQPQNLIQV